MASVHHIGNLKLKFLTAVHLTDKLYIIMLNFVGIGPTLQKCRIFSRCASEM